jgi:hypothetical protein
MTYRRNMLTVQSTQVFSTHTFLRDSVNHWVIYPMSWPFTGRCAILFALPPCMLTDYTFFYLFSTSVLPHNSSLPHYVLEDLFFPNLLLTHLCLTAFPLVVLSHTYHFSPSLNGISHRSTSFLYVSLCYPLHGLHLYSKDGVTLFLWNGAISTRICGVIISDLRTYQHERHSWIGKDFLPCTVFIIWKIYAFH